jgi:hypothetical protein
MFNVVWGVEIIEIYVMSDIHEIKEYNTVPVKSGSAKKAGLSQPFFERCA